MNIRKIININTDKCNGCGQCIPNCPEGAIQMIDGKARLVSDLFCDGLGACLGHCPQGAITIEERQAEEYDENKVMANIVKQGKNVIIAHLEHLRQHNQKKYLIDAENFLKKNNINIDGDKYLNSKSSCGCLGAKVVNLRNEVKERSSDDIDIAPQLGQWPVQIMLIPVNAGFLKDADLLIAADCLPFAYPNFHQKLLKGKVLLVGCPKLDDINTYQDKITRIFQNNNIKSVIYAHMEVPCCSGLIKVIRQAISDSKRDIPFQERIVSIKGEIL